MSSASPIRNALPVDAVLEELVAAVERRGAVVLVAPTGAGKTTRVPEALLAATARGEVLVLEPRRLAARLAAEHVARERGEAPGSTVGYTVRFDDCRGPTTRLRYVTSGVLLRMLPGNPELRGITVLVFDELHERHVEDDVLLAWARRLRAGPRPDLKVVAMSATLDPGPVATYLDAPVVRSEGRAWPVVIEHEQGEDSRPLGLRVASALGRLVDDGLDGDVLVFLSGVAAIERCAGACRRLAAEANLELVALHGALSPEATRAALAPRPPPVRKVLLSTNVAESSITLSGVAAVVDSGLHKVARSSPWTGLVHLREEPVPRDSAIQRAGRAGRTRPGRCLRLYSEPDLRGRPLRLDPEVRRVDLAPVALTLAVAGLSQASDLDWLDAPEPARWDAARSLLEALGALADGQVTAEGRALLDLPMHPRLGMLVREAARQGHGPAGALAAALLGEDIRPAGDEPPSECDILSLMEAYRGRRLDRASEDRVRRAVVECRHALSGTRRAEEAPEGAAGPRWAQDEAIRRALLHAFPDRVAKRRAGEVYSMVGGLEAVMDRRSVVRDTPWLVAVDATGGGRPLVRLATSIEPDWLLELPGAEAALTEHLEVRWDDGSARVEASRTLRWRGLPIETANVPARGLAETEELLRRQVRAAGVGRFADADAVALLRDRLRFAHEVDPLMPWWSDGDILAALERMCQGKMGFREVRDADLLGALRGSLTPGQRRRLAEVAPERVPLPGGRNARVHYFPEGRPRVAAPIQHFFGMNEGPRLGSGRHSALLELLAPSGRPVQITDDLAGFWERTWTQVRKELRGRYPRHAWPEDPRAPVGRERKA